MRSVQISRRELFALQAQKDAEDEFAKQALKEMQEDIRLRKIAVVEAEKELQRQLEEERRCDELCARLAETLWDLEPSTP